MRNPMAAVLAFTILGSGCATTYNDKSASEVANAVRVQSSEFDKHAGYVGPPLTNERLLSSETYRLLQATNGETGKSGYALHVQFLYGGDWAFYETASFQGGEIVQLSVIRQVVSCSGGCNYLENATLVLPEGFLEAHREIGLRVRFNARRGHQIVEIHPAYIQGFLSVVPPESR